MPVCDPAGTAPLHGVLRPERETSSALFPQAKLFSLRRAQVGFDQEKLHGEDAV